MPGLLRGLARVGVAAGTWTAVSNGVSRRQANRWARQDEQQYYEQQGRAQAQTAPAPSAPPAPLRDTVQQLKDLADLKAQGILTDEELAAQKPRSSPDPGGLIPVSTQTVLDGAGPPAQRPALSERARPSERPRARVRACMPAGLVLGTVGIRARRDRRRPGAGVLDSVHVLLPEPSIQLWVYSAPLVVAHRGAAAQDRGVHEAASAREQTCADACVPVEVVRCPNG